MMGVLVELLDRARQDGLTLFVPLRACSEPLQKLGIVVVDARMRLGNSTREAVKQRLVAQFQVGQRDDENLRTRRGQDLSAKLMILCGKRRRVPNTRDSPFRPHLAVAHVGT